MIRLARAIVISACSMFVAAESPVAAAVEPDEVVRSYISAFKGKEKEKMLSCLSGVFFEEYRTQYLAKVESYDEEKQRALLRVFEVDSLETLKALTGKAILSTFLDKPASETYWANFDSLDLIIEVEIIEIAEGRAVVRSFLSSKATLPAKIETTYTLSLTDEGWKIDRFKKRRIQQ